MRPSSRKQKKTITLESLRSTWNANLLNGTVLPTSQNSIEVASSNDQLRQEGHMRGNQGSDAASGRPTRRSTHSGDSSPFARRDHIFDFESRSDEFGYEFQSSKSNESDASPGRQSRRSRSAADLSSCSNDSSPSAMRYQAPNSDTYRRSSKSKRTWSIIKRSHTRTKSRCMSSEESNCPSKGSTASSSDSTSFVSSSPISDASKCSPSDDVANEESTRLPWIPAYGSTGRACSSKESRNSLSVDCEKRDAYILDISETSCKTNHDEKQIHAPRFSNRSSKSNLLLLFSLLGRTHATKNSRRASLKGTVPESYITGLALDSGSRSASESSGKPTRSDRSRRFSSMFQRIRSGRKQEAICTFLEGKGGALVGICRARHRD